MVDQLPLLVASALEFYASRDIYFEGMTDEEVTDELIYYDGDIGDYKFHEVLKYVKIQRS